VKFICKFGSSCCEKSSRGEWEREKKGTRKEKVNNEIKRLEGGNERKE
jgi:hypothetical protein